jgi:hypothetical protein
MDVPTAPPVVAADVSAGLRARMARCLPALPGWTSVDKGVRMAELVVAANAELSVELGVFGGRGTIALALGHEALCRGRVFAIDPWERAASLEGSNAPENDAWWGALDHEQIYRGCLQALADAGVAPMCRVLRERSDVAVGRVADASVAVLHQDSNHSEAVSAGEVLRWAPKLAPGGYWIADDTDWPTTRRAQALLEEAGFRPVEDHGQWKVYRKR